MRLWSFCSGASHRSSHEWGWGGEMEMEMEMDGRTGDRDDGGGRVSVRPPAA